MIIEKRYVLCHFFFLTPFKSHRKVTIKIKSPIKDPNNKLGEEGLNQTFRKIRRFCMESPEHTSANISP